MKAILRIVDRYTITEFIGPFLLAACGFSVILLSGLLFELTDLIFSRNVPVQTVLKMLGYKLPGVVVITLPIGVLFATLLSLGRLAKDNELTVIRMAGVNVWRLVLPLIIAGSLVSGLTYLLNEEIVPWSNHQYEQIVRRLIYKNPVPAIEEQVFFRDGNDRVFYIGRVDSRDDRLYNVMIYETGRTFPRLITARKGTYNGREWQLEDGVVRELDESGFVDAEAAFSRMTIFTEEPAEVFFGRQKSTDEMNREELYRHIQLFKKSGIRVDGFEVDYHLKLALPAASLIFILIGVPFALKTSSGGRFAGVTASLAIVFLYYVVTAVSRSLGANGIVPPLLAAWLGNVIFGITGAGALLYLDR